MTTSVDTPQAAAFRRQVLNPMKLRLFMVRKLPMAWLAGLRLTQLTPVHATVTVRFKHLTQNPFRSIYFACLAMAAELASGMQAMMHVQGGSPVSMLVVKLEGDFMKKAVGLITFTCPDGPAIAQAVAESRATGEGRTIACTSTGVDEAGDVVAVFRLTWSFRAKR
ncbi:PaaI family thioesterase [Hymenobacter antarcticus]|uniref:Acyl-coenzyme A thioesterase PaaI, contains HGG motif n=1 Tax=Hymenobacter antarcticus TaxID=486270 RepID=A0ABP7Q1G9_9BACT